jgi:hypothetical protein
MPVVGDAAARAGAVGAGRLAAAGTVVARGWAPPPLARCGDPDAQADTRIIRPAGVTASQDEARTAPDRGFPAGPGGAEENDGRENR